VLTEWHLDREKRSLVLYGFALFLLWQWPFVSLVTHNKNLIVEQELLVLFFAKTLVFAALIIAFRLVFQRSRIALLALTIAVLLWIRGGQVTQTAGVGDWVMAIIYAGLIALAVTAIIYFFLRYEERFKLLVTVFASTVVLIQLPTFFSVFDLQEVDYPAAFEDSDWRVRQPQAPPHIIYIIPDLYASNEALNGMYETSNLAFTEALEQRGFHVWDDQVSNYPKTFMSLASTLNSAHLGPIAEQIPAKDRRYEYIYRMLRDHSVAETLTSFGYEYTHLGSLWDPAKKNQHADRNFYNTGPLKNRLTGVYLKHTPLWSNIGAESGMVDDCAKTPAKLDFVKRQIASDHPQFILWHTLIAHEPYMTQADGTCELAHDNPSYTSNYAELDQAYIDHISYFNRFALDLFDHSRERSKREMIFVIQSDEGPFPNLYREAKRNRAEPYNFLTASDREMYRKHAIFNAIYLPSRDYSELDTLQTPINNFRIIFREVFDIEIPFLEDKVYSFAYEDDPYALEEITDRLLNRDETRIANSD